MAAKNPPPKPFSLLTPRTTPANRSRAELAIHEESDPEEPSAWHKAGRAALIKASYTPGEGKRVIVSRIPLIREIKIGSEGGVWMSNRAKDAEIRTQYLSHSSSKRPTLR